LKICLHMPQTKKSTGRLIGILAYRCRYNERNAPRGIAIFEFVAHYQLSCAHLKDNVEMTSNFLKTVNESNIGNGADIPNIVVIAVVPLVSGPNQISGILENPC